ncbi:MAG TPA: DegT/DnrJ/EryC1/StrS family aminotransferase [Solirubrobacteraceae bacterium]|nr:DegT/DnrJ/EryC1/StrS family aminotransferase [Solirubrobacteraceae bacterium]
MPSVAFVDLARQHAQIADALSTTFNRVLATSGFILGEEVERFEAEFAQYCGTRCCVGVASGTAALTIMLQAAGIAPGDEVIVPAHTFVATALAVVHAGATPVCVDVDPGSGLIDPDAVAEAIGPATAAILAVHLYGQACAVEPLRALARRHGVLLLEDAAQAHGATYREARAGSLAHAAAFSFYPSKNLGALGDAGAVCTDDEVLAGKARRLRDLGRGADSIHRVPGYNERLDGLQAAVLRTKLRHLDEWNRARRLIAAAYVVNLDPSIELLEESPDSPCTYHVFPIRATGRDALKRELERAEISTRIHYRFPLTEQPALRSACTSASVPTAKDWTERELSLPIFPGMTDREIDRVVCVVNRWAGEQRDAKHELRDSHATLSR